MPSTEKHTAKTPDTALPVEMLEEILAGEVLTPTTEPTVDDLTLAAIEAEIENDEMKVTAYKEQESTGDIDLEAPEKAKKASKGKKTVTHADPDAEAAPAKAKVARVVFDKRSDALIHKLGGFEGIILSSEDAKLSPDALAEKQRAFVEGVDKLAIKLREKVINIMVAATKETGLSVYSKIALNLLRTKGSVSSKELCEAMIEAKYSVGTSRSQSQQMMQVLPYCGVATNTKGNLSLNADSVLFVALNEAGKF